ncbi:PTS mannitol transporter subunit IIA, partial [Salmonella enterica]|nr:PTS mannitol transporter subunit IIA [Salmonella enterica]
MNNIFTPDNIILNAQAKDKFDAIRITGNILKENGYV